MKKLGVGICVVMMALSVFSGQSVQAKEIGGAGPAILSFFLPGVGEWMNSDFEGTYPFGECIVGALCFPFMISSVIDAARGSTDQDLRFQFWTTPPKISKD